MGLAASQARLLTLTARQSDNEYRGQIINNRRLMLSDKMSTIANEYADGMANKQLKMVVSPDSTASAQTMALTSLTSAELYSFLSSDNFVLVDSNGQAVNTTTTTAADGTVSSSYIDKSGNTLSTKEIEHLLRAGTLEISNGTIITSGDGSTSYSLSFDWRSDESGVFKDTYNTTDDAAVAAKYEADSADVQGQDKRLEMELKNLDTEHKAIETEIDAVKKVIEKNVQGSFKTFG